MVQNGPKCFKTCPKCPKRVQKGQLWSNSDQICIKNHQNGSGITRSPGLVFTQPNTFHSPNLQQGCELRIVHPKASFINVKKNKKKHHCFDDKFCLLKCVYLQVETKFK